MASPVTTIIRIDPFYQRFLRVQLNQHEKVFEFPKGHDLSIVFQFFVSKAPDDFQPPKPSDELLEVAIPYMEHKNPLVYNFISERSNTFLVTRIREYQRSVFHEEIGKRKQKGLHKDEIIWQLIDEYSLSESDYDRVSRAYSRYLNAERQRKYLGRQKKENNRKFVSV